MTRHNRTDMMVEIEILKFGMYESLVKYPGMLDPEGRGYREINTFHIYVLDHQAMLLHNKALKKLQAAGEELRTVSKGLKGIYSHLLEECRDLPQPIESDLEPPEDPPPPE